MSKPRNKELAKDLFEKYYPEKAKELENAVTNKDPPIDQSSEAIVKLRKRRAGTTNQSNT